MMDLPAQTSPPLMAASANWTTIPQRPWRRLWARCYDYFLFGMGLSALIDIVLQAIDPTFAQKFDQFTDQRLGQALFATGTALLASIPLAWLLHVTGGSPGKWMCGIRVLRRDGTRLSVRAALAREFGALWLGYGCGVPFWGLYACYRAYQQLKATGTTVWDTEQECQLHYRGRLTWRIVIGILVMLAMLALAVTCSPDAAVSPAGGA